MAALRTTVGVVLVCGLPKPGTVAAEELPPPIASLPLYEIWTGVDATSTSVYGYSGGVYAPAGVLEVGLRLKAQAGWGRYRYDSESGAGGRLDHEGEIAELTALIGYQWKLGVVTAKLYAGLSAASQDVHPVDVGNAATGDELGARIEAETWIDLHPSWWLSADAAFSQPFEAWQATVRLGVRLSPETSVGLEAGGLGNESYAGGRAGLVLMTATPVGELRLSGGFGGTRADDLSPYGAASLLVRF